MEILRNLFLAPKRGNHNLFAAALNMLLASCFIVAVFWLSLKAINVEFDFTFLGQFRIRLWKGFVMTLCVGITSLFLSLVIGCLRLAPTCGKIFL